MTLELTPVSSLRVSKHYITRYEGFPNCSIQCKPLLIYHGAIHSPSVPHIEAHLSAVGVVRPQWRYSMFANSHFHSNTHEVLCVAEGAAKCCFGYEENPDRVDVELRAGDVVIIPAGVAHRLVEDCGGFLMVGSYPVDKGSSTTSWDMCYGGTRQWDQVKERIEKVEWFKDDPVFADGGPVQTV